MNRIIVRHYRVPLPPHLTKPSMPVRIAVIGDLHNHVFGEGNQKLVRKICEQRPDLICSVGDLTVCKPKKETNIDVAVSLLRRLSCECPVYWINGNHEFRAKIWPESYPGVYERLVKSLHMPNITLLEDEKADVDIRGVALTIHGFELPMPYYKKFTQPFLGAQEIREHIGVPDGGRFNILLAHNPVYFESYALWGADLTLSGHLHGGLVRLPLLGGIVSPQVRLFPRYDCGRYEKYGRQMLVTAGLGSHSVALRVHNPAEFMLIELY